MPPYSMVIFSLIRKLQKKFHIWLEIYFQYLKWVFRVISFRCLVDEIYCFEATHVCNQRGRAPFNFGIVFLTPWATAEQVPYTDGNISSVAQMGLRKNWISSYVA
jgi:hypothetical protein